MRGFVITIAAATVFVAGTPMIGASVGAAPIAAPGAIRAAADSVNMVETVQFIWLGRNYCWYDDGWNGPGWYWCGQYLTRGIGFGGGYGWHHWHGGHPGGGGGMGGGGMGGGGMGGGGMGGGGMGGGGMGGGGMGGGGMGGGGMGGGGMGGGGMGGGGMMSDIQVKHDIVLLGHLDNGLGFYRFSYNGSDKAYVGVIAQEVEAVMPEAVVHGSDGYLRVKYDMLGIRMQTWEEWVASGQKIPLTSH
jgi:hypothetical protein